HPTANTGAPPAGNGRSVQLSPPSELANPSPPLVALYIRFGCRSSKAMLNIVLFGLIPMSMRLQLVPPSLLRNRTPTSLWNEAPAATQIVFGSPGTSRISRQYVWPLGFSGSSLALAPSAPP